MKTQLIYEAPDLYVMSVCVEKGFAASSDIEPGTGGGELATTPVRSTISNNGSAC